MDDKSIVLVGGPGTGKSNYLARLWLALRGRQYSLVSTSTPENIKYVEELAEHLLRGSFAPRTEPTDIQRDFQVAIKSTDDSINAEILVPDMYGEIWKKAVKTLEIPEKWLKMLRASNAAILFVRARSELIVEPLDWVNSQRLIKAGVPSSYDENSVPTQVSLLELLRFLEENLQYTGEEFSKVAVVITAWDLLDKEESVAGPTAFLEKQFPMFAGRLADTLKIKTKVFGVSIVGGDFDKDEEFVEEFLNGRINQFGYVVTDETGDGSPEVDVTEPLRWLLG